MLDVADTRTPARVAAVAVILATVAILQWTVADWSVLGLGFFNLAPIVLAAIWLGVPGAVVASLAAGVITTLNLAGAPDPPSTGQLAVGFAIRELGYHGMALFIAITMTRLRRTATTDPLTGLANRRAFFQSANSFRDRHGRATLVACDVNGLKAINDTFGHARGDEVIVETGRSLREALGRGALVARVGGDEFLALSGEPLEAVERAVHRIVGTGALGVQAWGEGQSIDDAVADADRRLYAHKREQAARRQFRATRRHLADAA